MSLGIDAVSQGVLTPARSRANRCSLESSLSGSGNTDRSAIPHLSESNGRILAFIWEEQNTAVEPCVSSRREGQGTFLKIRMRVALDILKQ